MDTSYAFLIFIHCMPTIYYPTERKDKPIVRIRIHTEILTFFALFIITTSYAQVNLNQGLIAHYPFTGNANDVSGNNINGAVSNAVLTTDRNGIANNAYYFNGTNAYIQLPFSSLYNFKPQDSFSISVWVLPDPGYSWPAQAVVVKAPPHPDFTLSQWNYGTYILNYKGMSGYAYNNILNGSTTLTPNQCWYNITSTYKNGVWKLYVNGVLESTNNSQTRFILQDGTSRIAFGKKGESFGDWYKGKMDDVRLYNRVLNEDEVKAIVGQCQLLSNCNNWLRTTNPGDAVKIGDLDITGNQLTVEATFNRVSPYTGGYLYGGDLVSKHDQPTDCNYLLRPNNAEITTTNGFFQTAPVCEIELNKTYHVAMTYNGSSLKFYRNGFLLKEMPASGNLIQNNWLTTIGDYAPGTPGTPENLNGYINEVRIWNVARSQADIRTYMNSSLPNPTTQTGLLAYYTFDNLLNKQGNSAWNGTLIGGASVNATNTSCTFSADSCVTLTCSQKNDFGFEQNTCNPYQITFSTTSTTYQTIKWDFGDSNSSTGSASVSHTYSLPGVYLVKMIQNYQNCTDTVTKTLTVTIQNDNQAILTADTTICIGSTKQLQASPALSYCWSPAAYLSDPTIQNPVTSTPGSITYYLTTQKKGNNLVVNGDFAAGNTGFLSDYQYVPPSGFNPGVYTVSNNPVAWHPQMPNCNDHTPGTNGNMMIVNGAEIANVKVWSQTITVQPNTNYAFETWLQHMTSSNPAKLQFAINGVTIGPAFVANNTNCIWDRFYAVWNSGNSTSANISIVNQNQVYTGNDFA
ncbi:MAG: PKD domain-containing protein, partial [Chitinophagaceae bacterium]|nr:PKD domain-containing protein [Chitinophagaceae bacterium]